VSNVINNNNEEEEEAMSGDFLSLCRVVNGLNAGFAQLRSQVEAVVCNLDLVSKSNNRIHEKVATEPVSNLILNSRGRQESNLRVSA
jgi:hypothetical protein